MSRKAERRIVKRTLLYVVKFPFSANGRSFDPAPRTSGRVKRQCEKLPRDPRVFRVAAALRREKGTYHRTLSLASREGGNVQDEGSMKASHLDASSL